MLRPGIARAGFLLDRQDRDFYSFSVREPSHILLQVTSPPDVMLMATVSQRISPSYSFSAKSPGDNARMDVMLPPGDYSRMTKAAQRPIRFVSTCSILSRYRLIASLITFRPRRRHYPLILC